MSTRPAAAQRNSGEAAVSLPPVKVAASPSSSANRGTSGDRGKKHKSYHKCTCYGHDKALPDYKMLQMPRTNNYYAATGGCPCIPRAPAHPGSWRLKEAQMRSSTHKCGNGCINKHPEVSHKCCQHSGTQYGWRPGPHTVKDKNTAAAGKCDTFGNLAFKSKSRAYMPVEDDVSDLSSVSPQKLEDLEALILEEHEARIRAESDVHELKDIYDNDAQDTYKQDKELQDRRRFAAQATDEQFNELLRDIRGIVDRPLNQTNMDLLRRLVARQEMLQRNRDYQATKAVLGKDSM